VSVDGTLHRLLFERSYREAFLCGDVAALGLSPAELAVLSTIDKEQLGRAARLACDGILHRSHPGTGSLLDAFPETVAAWRRAHPEEGLEGLADALVASPHFARCRVLPSCDGGISLEEVFWRVAEDASIGDAAKRKAECATALLKALVVTRSPSFALPDFMLRAPRGWFAVVVGESAPLLVGAADDRFIFGPITPFLAALLVSGEPPERVAARFGIGASDLSKSCDELRRLGLLA
jgi:hypothetical protein